MSKITDKYDDRGLVLEQDATAYLDYAHEARKAGVDKKANFRSFAIIPDIVAVDIFTKFGIDINNPENTQVELNKFKKIIKDHYPLLLTTNINRGG
jgi:hypothetical protein